MYSNSFKLVKVCDDPGHGESWSLCQLQLERMYTLILLGGRFSTYQRQAVDGGGQLFYLLVGFLLRAQSTMERSHHCV